MTDQSPYRNPPEREIVRWQPVWCCISEPANRFGNYLWGALLIIGGGIWLLQNIGLLSGTLLDVLWPLLLAGAGVSIVGWALYGRSQEIDHQ